MCTSPRLLPVVTGLVADAAREGEVRHDIVAGELASYCLHALTAASGLPSEAAARRLVSVTLDGLRPVPDGPDATAKERSARDATAARSGAQKT